MTNSTLISINPATGEQVWSGTQATATDIAEAVQLAKKTFETWRLSSVEERINCLKEFQRQLELERHHLSRIISEETGKAAWDADGEVAAMMSKICLLYTSPSPRDRG